MSYFHNCFILSIFCLVIVMDCDGFVQYLTVKGVLDFNVYFNLDLSVCMCVYVRVCEGVIEGI